MAIPGFGSRGLAVAAVGLMMLIGSGRAPALEQPAPAQPAKAWVEAKSLCIFRLGEGRMPEDSHELSVALNDGWKTIIFPPDPDKTVFIDGGPYPSINTLRIDFSDALLRPASKKDKIDLNNRVEKNLDVGHLEVRGEPMLLRSAKLNMRLVADGAQLDMERDRRGRPVMMLAKAKNGSLSFDVSRADAEAIMLQNAREMAARSGVSIEKLRLTIVPETPRSLQVSLYVLTKVAMIPAGMLFKAHVVVDDSMNARISGLTCDGDEALGPLIVHFLRPALARYNGRTRPLVSFPAKSMQLHDVAVRVDDGLHLTADFGT